MENTNREIGRSTIDQYVEAHGRLRVVVNDPAADFFQKQEAMAAIFALRMSAYSFGFALETYKA